ncbi:MAG: MBL fold metallo-hydrolase [Clostridia bacterium]|nr:MBL fold metallo-hydrolase [Clostridia bacterium]
MIGIEVISLYSGSKGNSTLVRSGRDAVLIDAGKSARALETALRSAGEDIDRISAVFITHEHADHLSALRVITKKHSIPVHMTEPAAKAGGLAAVYPSNSVNVHPPLYSVQVGSMRVRSFVVPHDSSLCNGFRIETENDSVGIVTDCGRVTEEVFENLAGCRIIVIEANHDIKMLEDGPYQPSLKARVASPLGHLSNSSCAETVVRLAGTGTESVLLAHLSEINNTPDLAVRTVEKALRSAGSGIRVAAASQNEITRAEV